MDGLQVNQSLYEPLPNPERYIRLLEICPALASNGMIQCELSTWATDVAPSYHAISYTWGDHNSLSLVRVNGMNIQVGKNCHYALRQVVHDKHSRYHWIDTLCINQGDNYEKGFQVSMMGDIYRSAERVLACVGRHKDDSAFLLETLNRNADLFARASKTYPGYGDPSEEVKDHRGHSSSQTLLKWKLSQSFASRSRLLKAFYEFEFRPYFQRVWTLQELFMAKKITVLCGQDHCSGRTIHGFYRAIEDKHNDTLLGSLTDWTLCYRDEDTWLGSVTAKLGMLADKRLPVLRRLIPWNFYDPPNSSHRSDLIRGFTHFTALRSPGLLSPWRAIRTACYLECYDPRDRLYGLLSLVDWTGVQKPRPNYDSDVFDLALDVLRFCALPLEESPNMDANSDPMSVALWIMDSFELTKQSTPKLSASIQQRRVNQLHKTSTAGPVTIDRTLPRYPSGYFWPGNELRLVNNSDGRPKYVNFGRPRQQLNYENGIFTGPKGVQALLPSFTRSGDILVSHGGTSLVIRPRPDGRYDLVGQWLFFGGAEFKFSPWYESKEEPEENRYFRMFFHGEDLLTLVHNSIILNERCSCKSLIEVSELLRFSPGLSYVEEVSFMGVLER
ncbi:heterokaryon incompatibility protein-domain-containing protein [Xylaria flabelliformis]|nr:heterokaryon incompatibility protein-domain-containing protein [Xylaria flabelliformis]